MKVGKTVVCTFNDREKAETARTYLAGAGIQAEVVHESALQRLWFASKPLAHEKVYVAKEDFRRATEAFRTASHERRILLGEVRCPQCGSAEIEYPQLSRKFVTTTMVEILFWLGILDKRFYCVGCHYTWPAKEKLRTATDVLNWPVKGDAPLVKKESH